MAAAAPNWFRSKTRVPSLVGHLPRVSYVCFVGHSMKERWWSRREHRGSAHISWHLPYDWGKPQKISVRKLLEALSSMTSHCYKWGPFPPNEVDRAMLPAPLAKPIRIQLAEHAQIFEIWNPKIPRPRKRPSRPVLKNSAPQSNWWMSSHSTSTIGYHIFIIVSWAARRVNSVKSLWCRRSKRRVGEWTVM